MTLTVHKKNPFDEVLCGPCRARTYDPQIMSLLL